MTDQSHLVLLWLQQLLNRAAIEHHKDRCLILDLMRRIRQQQAEQEFEEIEASRKLEPSIDWTDIPF
jgi:hypothetical protein